MVKDLAQGKKCLIWSSSRLGVFTQHEFEILSLEFLMFVLAKDFDGTAGCKSSKTIIAGGCQSKIKKFAFCFLSIDEEDKGGGDEKFERDCGMPTIGYSAGG